MVAEVDAAMVDAVVFDVGNVLIEWDPRHLYRRVFTNDDGTPDEARVAWFLAEVCHPGWNLEQDRGRSIADAEAEALSRHPELGPAIRSFYGRFQTMIPGAIAGSVAVLEALKAAGMPVHGRSEERRVGKECVSTCRSRWVPYR